MKKKANFEKKQANIKDVHDNKIRWIVKYLDDENFDHFPVSTQDVHSYFHLNLFSILLRLFLGRLSFSL